MALVVRHKNVGVYGRQIRRAVIHRGKGMGTKVGTGSVDGECRLLRGRGK